MTIQQVLNNAAIINRQYSRGILTYGELNAELWQLAHELAFYMHTDVEWRLRQATWADHPELMVEFWEEMFELVAASAR